MKNVFVPPREPAPKQNSIAFVAGVIEDGLILRMAGEAEPRRSIYAAGIMHRLRKAIVYIVLGHA